MSDVYRYDLSLPTNAKNFGMRLSENGCWVEHESYAALESKLASLRAERDQLRARVVTLEIEREAQRSCAIYWMDQENTLRASIVALAERLEGVNESWAEYIVGELRQLGESNSAAAQEGL